MRRKILKGCLITTAFLLLCLVCYIGASWEWWWQYTPRWYWFQSNVVYFERVVNGTYYYAQWSEEKGVTLGFHGTYSRILYTAPPGHGRAYARWVELSKHPLVHNTSYERGFVDSLPYLLGEGRIRWTPDGHFLLTSQVLWEHDDFVGSRLILVTPNRRIQVVMVEGEGWRLWDPDLSVRGLLAYSRGPWEDDTAPREIVVRDFQKHTAWVVGKGVNPTWSPDGEWLAYTGYDGIYIVRWNGQERRRVVACPTQEAMDDIWDWTGPARWWKWPPRPDWSPDGQWLIYHRLEDGEYNIYKFNLKTGREILLIRNGLHPQWRWLRQEVAYPPEWGIPER